MRFHPLFISFAILPPYSKFNFQVDLSSLFSAPMWGFQKQNKCITYASKVSEIAPESFMWQTAILIIFQNYKQSIAQNTSLNCKFVAGAWINKLKEY
jgi:hypothetical protein